MYISSKSHGEKIYHTQLCTYARRMKPENKKAFYTVEEAIANGCRACNCCSVMGRKYQKEKKAIQNFARENRMKLWIDNNVVYIETETAAWKIIPIGKTKKIGLYHANMENYRFCKKEKGKIIHNYHFQKGVKADSIMGFLKYIKSHDEWRESIKDDYKMLPTRTKGQRKKYKEAKDRAKKRAVGKVLNMIEVMKVEREYMER